MTQMQKAFLCNVYIETLRPLPLSVLVLWGGGGRSERLPFQEAMAMETLWPTSHPDFPTTFQGFDHLDASSLDQLQERFMRGEELSASVRPLQHQLKTAAWPLPGDQFLATFNAVLVNRLSSGSLRPSASSGQKGPRPSGLRDCAVASALPVLATAPGQGRSCKLPGWLEAFKGSPELSKMLSGVIESGPAKLAANKYGVRISNSIDFGIKRASWSNRDMLTIPCDQMTPQFFRSLIITNKGAERLILVDVCGIPAIDDIFTFHDDYNMAHHHGRGKSHMEHDILKSGVMLQPGDEYQVTVELRCDRHEYSFHQQWLLFTFARDESHLGKMPTDNAFVIGRHISVLIAKNVQEVQTCLSVEAKPFFPKVLRGLFDTPPAYFSVGDSYSRLLFMEQPVVHPACDQTATLAVWPIALQQIEQELNLEVHKQDLLEIQLKHHISESSNENNHKFSLTMGMDHCSCLKLKLRQLSRLLALEEAAMNNDIKDFDLFNVHFSYHRESLFELEVPGLPENRPSVFVGDVVYVRWAAYPNTECAAIVHASESKPSPRLILRLSKDFLSVVFPFTYQGKFLDLPEVLQRERVHARFTFDRLMFKRMHEALRRVARSSPKLLPCSCTKGAHKISRELSLIDSLDDGSKSVITAKPLELKNQSLNTEQQEAVRNVLDEVSGCQPYVIFGPPGTGKTVTMVECVLQVIMKDEMARVCICAPSNYAADILCSGIAAGGIGASKMWRLNDPRRNIASVKIDVLPFCHYNTKLGLFDLHPNPSSLQVIVCTCGAAGLLHEHPLSENVESFTHIFIDEAGQALVPEALIPLSLGNVSSCRVLCGDPCQLGPVVHSKLAATYGLSRSLLEGFMLSEKAMKQNAKSPLMTKLVRNYRANSKLLELPSRLFYNNELIASAEVDVTPPKDWEELNEHEFPMLFYGTKGQQMREGESPSLFNPVEAARVVDLVKGLLSCAHVTVGDIGVMAPYRRQVQKIRLLLRMNGLGTVRVGTVDDYQGQEERIIFISTVLTKLEPMRSLDEDGMEQPIGFIHNDKRFNVAITRAKAMLVVVGHPLVLSHDKNWSKLLQYCVMHDAYRGYGSQLLPTFIQSAISPLDSFMQEIEYGDATEDDAEMTRAIEKLAELSLLGMGDMDRVYPDSLDAMYSAYNEDLEWRVML